LSPASSPSSAASFMYDENDGVPVSIIGKGITDHSFTAHIHCANIMAHFVYCIFLCLLFCIFLIVLCVFIVFSYSVCNFSTLLCLWQLLSPSNTLHQHRILVVISPVRMSQACLFIHINKITVILKLSTIYHFCVNTVCSRIAVGMPLGPSVLS